MITNGMALPLSSRPEYPGWESDWRMYGQASASGVFTLSAAPGQRVFREGYRYI